VRTEWYLAVRQFFREYDHLIVPTAQLLPFDAGFDWPKKIGAGQWRPTTNG
jgi:amidase